MTNISGNGPYFDNFFNGNNTVTVNTTETEPIQTNGAVEENGVNGSQSAKRAKANGADDRTSKLDELNSFLEKLTTPYTFTFSDYNKLFKLLHDLEIGYSINQYTDDNNSASIITITFDYDNNYDDDSEDTVHVEINISMDISEQEDIDDDELFWTKDELELILKGTDLDLDTILSMYFTNVGVDCYTLNIDAYDNTDIYEPTFALLKNEKLMLDKCGEILYQINPNDYKSVEELANAINDAFFSNSNVTMEQVLFYINNRLSSYQKQEGFYGYFYDKQYGNKDGIEAKPIQTFKDEYGNKYYIEKSVDAQGNEIYEDENHVVIKDENGNMFTIEKNDYDNLNNNRNKIILCNNKAYKVKVENGKFVLETYILDSHIGEEISNITITSVTKDENYESFEYTLGGNTYKLTRDAKKEGEFIGSEQVLIDANNVKDIDPKFIEKYFIAGLEKDGETIKYIINEETWPIGYPKPGSEGFSVEQFNNDIQFKYEELNKLINYYNDLNDGSNSFSFSDLNELLNLLNELNIYYKVMSDNGDTPWLGITFAHEYNGQSEHSINVNVSKNYLDNYDKTEYTMNELKALIRGFDFETQGNYFTESGGVNQNGETLYIINMSAIEQDFSYLDDHYVTEENDNNYNDHPFEKGAVLKVLMGLLAKEKDILNNCGEELYNINLIGISKEDIPVILANKFLNNADYSQLKYYIENRLGGEIVKYDENNPNEFIFKLFENGYWQEYELVRKSKGEGQGNPIIFNESDISADIKTLFTEAGTLKKGKYNSHKNIFEPNSTITYYMPDLDSFPELIGCITIEEIKEKILEIQQNRINGILSDFLSGEKYNKIKNALIAICINNVQSETSVDTTKEYITFVYNNKICTFTRFVEPENEKQKIFFDESLISEEIKEYFIPAFQVGEEVKGYILADWPKNLEMPDTAEEIAIVLKAYVAESTKAVFTTSYSYEELQEALGKNCNEHILNYYFVYDKEKECYYVKQINSQFSYETEPQKAAISAAKKGENVLAAINDVFEHIQAYISEIVIMGVADKIAKTVDDNKLASIIDEQMKLLFDYFDSANDIQIEFKPQEGENLYKVIISVLGIKHTIHVNSSYSGTYESTSSIKTNRIFNASDIEDDIASNFLTIESKQGKQYVFKGEWPVGIGESQDVLIAYLKFKANPDKYNEGLKELNERFMVGNWGFESMKHDLETQFKCTIQSAENNGNSATITYTTIDGRTFTLNWNSEWSDVFFYEIDESLKSYFDVALSQNIDGQDVPQTYIFKRGWPENVGKSIEALKTYLKRKDYEINDDIEMLKAENDKFMRGEYSLEEMKNILKNTYNCVCIQTSGDDENLKHISYETPAGNTFFVTWKSEWSGLTPISADKLNGFDANVINEYFIRVMSYQAKDSQEVKRAYYVINESVWAEKGIHGRTIDALEKFIERQGYDAKKDYDNLFGNNQTFISDGNLDNLINALKNYNCKYTVTSNIDKSEITVTYTTPAGNTFAVTWKSEWSGLTLFSADDLGELGDDIRTYFEVALSQGGAGKLYVINNDAWNEAGIQGRKLSDLKSYLLTRMDEASIKNILDGICNKLAENSKNKDYIKIILKNVLIAKDKNNKYYLNLTNIEKYFGKAAADNITSDNITSDNIADVLTGNIADVLTGNIYATIEMVFDAVIEDIEANEAKKESLNDDGVEALMKKLAVLEDIMDGVFDNDAEQSEANLDIKVEQTKLNEYKITIHAEWADNNMNLQERNKTFVVTAPNGADFKNYMDKDSELLNKLNILNQQLLIDGDVDTFKTALDKLFIEYSDNTENHTITYKAPSGEVFTVKYKAGGYGESEVFPAGDLDDEILSYFTPVAYHTSNGATINDLYVINKWPENVERTIEALRAFVEANKQSSYPEEVKAEFDALNDKFISGDIIYSELMAELEKAPYYCENFAVTEDHSTITYTSKGTTYTVTNTGGKQVFDAQDVNALGNLIGTYFIPVWTEEQTDTEGNTISINNVKYIINEEAWKNIQGRTIKDLNLYLLSQQAYNSTTMNSFNKENKYSPEEWNIIISCLFDRDRAIYKLNLDYLKKYFSDEILNNNDVSSIDKLFELMTDDIFNSMISDYNFNQIGSEVDKFFAQIINAVNSGQSIDIDKFKNDCGNSGLELKYSASNIVANLYNLTITFKKGETTITRTITLSMQNETQRELLQLAEPKPEKVQDTDESIYKFDKNHQLDIAATIKNAKNFDTLVKALGTYIKNPQKANGSIDFVYNGKTYTVYCPKDCITDLSRWFDKAHSYDNMYSADEIEKLPERYRAYFIPAIEENGNVTYYTLNSSKIKSEDLENLDLSNINDIKNIINSYVPEQTAEITEVETTDVYDYDLPALINKIKNAASFDALVKELGTYIKNPQKANGSIDFVYNGKTYTVYCPKDSISNLSRWFDKAHSYDNLYSQAEMTELLNEHPEYKSFFIPAIAENGQTTYYTLDMSKIANEYTAEKLETLPDDYKALFTEKTDADGKINYTLDISKVSDKYLNDINFIENILSLQSPQQTVTNVSGVGGSSGTGEAGGDFTIKHIDDSEDDNIKAIINAINNTTNFDTLVRALSTYITNPQKRNGSIDFVYNGKTYTVYCPKDCITDLSRWFDKAHCYDNMYSADNIENYDISSLIASLDETQIAALKKELGRALNGKTDDEINKLIEERLKEKLKSLFIPAIKEGDNTIYYTLDTSKIDVSKITNWDLNSIITEVLMPIAVPKEEPDNYPYSDAEDLISQFYNPNSQFNKSNGLDNINVLSLALETLGNPFSRTFETAEDGSKYAIFNLGKRHYHVDYEGINVFNGKPVPAATLSDFYYLDQDTINEYFEPAVYYTDKDGNEHVLYYKLKSFTEDDVYDKNGNVEDEIKKAIYEGASINDVISKLLDAKGGALNLLINSFITGQVDINNEEELKKWTELLSGEGYKIDSFTPADALGYRTMKLVPNGERNGVSDTYTLCIKVGEDTQNIKTYTKDAIEEVFAKWADYNINDVKNICKYNYILETYFYCAEMINGNPKTYAAKNWPEGVTRPEDLARYLNNLGSDEARMAEYAKYAVLDIQTKNQGKPFGDAYSALTELQSTYPDLSFDNVSIGDGKIIIDVKHKNNSITTITFGSSSPIREVLNAYSDRFDWKIGKDNDNQYYVVFTSKSDSSITHEMPVDVTTDSLIQLLTLVAQTQQQELYKFITTINDAYKIDIQELINKCKTEGINLNYAISPSKNDNDRYEIILSKTLSDGTVVSYNFYRTFDIPNEQDDSSARELLKQIRAGYMNYMKYEISSGTPLGSLIGSLKDASDEDKLKLYLAIINKNWAEIKHYCQQNGITVSENNDAHDGENNVTLSKGNTSYDMSIDKKVITDYNTELTNKKETLKGKIKHYADSYQYALIAVFGTSNINEITKIINNYNTIEEVKAASEAFENKIDELNTYFWSNMSSQYSVFEGTSRVVATLPTTYTDANGIEHSISYSSRSDFVTVNDTTGEVTIKGGASLNDIEIIARDADANGVSTYSACTINVIVNDLSKDNHGIDFSSWDSDNKVGSKSISQILNESDINNRGLRIVKDIGDDSGVEQVAKAKENLSDILDSIKNTLVNTYPDYKTLIENAIQTTKNYYNALFDATRFYTYHNTVTTQVRNETDHGGLYTKKNLGTQKDEPFTYTNAVTGETSTDNPSMYVIRHDWDSNDSDMKFKDVIGKTNGQRSTSGVYVFSEADNNNDDTFVFVDLQVVLQKFLSFMGISV